MRDIGVTGVQTCALPISLFHLIVPRLFCPAALSSRSRTKPANREPVVPALPPAAANRVAALPPIPAGEIGRASCRARVKISVVAVSLQKKRTEYKTPKTG